ncbi:MAG: arginine deiminase family protein, partial [Chloroflexia bacterium]
MNIHVTSEYGRLREAIMHRPGRELVRMTPSTRDYFLFDDLLYDEHAQQEHDWLVDLLQNHLGVKVHLFEHLLTEALAAASHEERDRLISQVRQLEQDMPPVEQRIGQLEVLVRWFQGQGWPQYMQDPEGAPAAAAPGSLPGSLAQYRTGLAGVAGKRVTTTPLAGADVDEHELTYLQQRLASWCEAGDFTSLGEELVEGIESRVGGVSPSQRPGPREDGNGNKSRKGPPMPGEEADALRRFVEGKLFYLTPLPNLMFIHDVGTVVGSALLMGRMAAPGRSREPLLLDFVHRHHPRFNDVPRWTWADARVNDPAWPLAASPLLHMEGGNVVRLRDDLIVLGVGERTSMESVQRLADVWRARSVQEGRKVVLYILRLPAGFNHLDSVLGIISLSECVIYPPVFEPYGPASVDVVRVELGEGPVKPVRSPDFFESLRNDGVDLTPIPCGGQDPTDQQREQWFSAANLLAVAPGKVIIYRSSERTIDELRNRGYRVVDINDVQTGTVRLSLDDEEKWVLKVKGSELARGHGGPHSLVLPLVRD